MEGVHHRGVLLEGDEDRLQGAGHQEAVRQGVHRGGLESQGLLEDLHREVHLVHRLDQDPLQVLHLVCHLVPIQEGHQEAHLVRRAGERRLEDRLVAPREALLLDLFHQEVAQPVLRHHLPELLLLLWEHPCRLWRLQVHLPHRNSVVWASSACEVWSSRLARVCLVRLIHTLDSG